MRHNTKVYLVAWDKPGTRSAPGRFYRELKREFRSEVRFIQRSVYGTRTFEIARRLAGSAKRYGLKVVMFRAAEIGREPNTHPKKVYKRGGVFTIGRWKF